MLILASQFKHQHIYHKDIIYSSQISLMEQIFYTIETLSDTLNNVFVNRRFINEKCRHSKRTKTHNQHKSQLIKIGQEIKPKTEHSFQLSALLQRTKIEHQLTPGPTIGRTSLFYQSFRKIEKVFSGNKQQNKKSQLLSLTTSSQFAPEQSPLLAHYSSEKIALNSSEKTKLLEQSHILASTKAFIGQQQKHEGFSFDMKNNGIFTKTIPAKITNTVGLESIGQKYKKLFKKKFLNKPKHDTQKKQHFSLPNFVVANTKTNYNPAGNQANSNRVLPLGNKQHKHVIIIQAQQVTKQPQAKLKQVIVLKPQHDLRKTTRKNDLQNANAKKDMQKNFEPWSKHSSSTKLGKSRLRN